jgi:predicted phosphodiesterase
VPPPLLRIVSDLHYGDHASRVTRLPQLRPLLDGVDHLVLNGDTLDTRPGPHPAHTADCRAAVLDFFPRHARAVTLLSGNHDPDFTPRHQLDLAGGEIWVTHGDVFFDDLVPWGNDAPLLRTRLAAELAALPAAQRDDLAARFTAVRRVALSIPQRHQSERNVWKYALHFLGDTVWPPARLGRVVRAWREGPRLAAAFARRHRPRARFVVVGHTHRPGLVRTPDGLVVLNTGSFCAPLAGHVVDVAPGRIALRALARRGGEFRAGAIIAEFPLAET